jgi:hypothetical protein
MNTKDNLMILGKDRRSLEQEGFENDEVEYLEEYVLGEEKEVVINYLESAIRNICHLRDCLSKLQTVPEDKKQKLQEELNYVYLSKHLREVLESTVNALDQIKSRETL